ncbi:MAG TPA: aldo/keto reductase [Terriglobales bacterium]|nr:aldo/keto reductase [Terriglobales bacterium]
MKYRQLGRTGLQVSEIGFGAWGIGKSEWVGAEDQASLTALKSARDAGINFFDTALAYGMGHSEQLLARAFGKSSEVLIASKVPPKNFIWPAQPGVPLREVFPRQYVLSSLDQSLNNLGREAVDLYQFHVWNDEWAGNDEWLSTVRDIRASGKARFLGISINDHQPANSLKALATGLIDAVQVIYNLFDQSPEDELFPYCRQHNIGVLARVPFDEGSLTGKIRPDTTFPEGDFRNQYFGGQRKQEVWDRLQRLTKDAAISVQDLPQFALRFCLSDPAVSTVIPGMRTPAHVASNAAASAAGPLSPAVLQKIRPHRWVRNFYD